MIFFYPVSTCLLCVRASLRVSVCVSSHVPDSPLILSLDCCLHAYFLCVTLICCSAVWNCSWISTHQPSPTATLSYCNCDSHCALFQPVVWKMAVFLIPSLIFGQKTMFSGALAAGSIFGLTICQTGATGTTPNQQGRFEEEQLGCSSGGPSCL